MADREPPFEQRLRAEGAEQRELHGGGHDPPDTEAAGEGSVNLTKQALRLIYANKQKTDEVDAENLARLARLDPKLLYPLKHRGEDSHAHMALKSARGRRWSVLARSWSITLGERSSPGSTVSRTRASWRRVESPSGISDVAMARASNAPAFSISMMSAALSMSAAKRSAMSLRSLPYSAVQRNAVGYRSRTHRRAASSPSALASGNM